MERKSISGSVVNADSVGMLGIALVCFGFLFTSSLETSMPVEDETPIVIEQPAELSNLELPLIQAPQDSTPKNDSQATPPVAEAPAPAAEKTKKRRVSYKERYETSSDTRIIVWTWEGGATVRKDQLQQTIAAVHERLSIVPKGNGNLVSLILETSAAESLRGIYVEQKGGPAEGLFQMEPATERFMRGWLKKVFPTVYDEVMHFYEASKSAEWNRVYNVPYAIAMSTAYYWHRCGDSLVERIDTIEERAKLWKLHYNTPLGKGTTEGYLRKADKYL